MVFVGFYLRYFFSYGSSKIRNTVRLMTFLNLNGNERLAKFFSKKLECYGVYISPRAKLPIDLKLPHPCSIVIGEGVVLESNVTIYQNVTLGGKVIGDWKNNNYPKIGKNTVVFAGACILGKVNIGDNCTIGANSVVISDLPDNSIAVGAPAKIINKCNLKESL